MLSLSAQYMTEGQQLFSNIKIVFDYLVFIRLIHEAAFGN